MNGFLWAALAGVVAVAVSAWVRHSARADQSALVGVETSTASQLHEVHAAAVQAAGEGAFSETVELVAAAQPGPAGLLTAPFSQVPCVFHRSQTTRRYREVTRDSDGKRQSTTKTEVVADEHSDDSIVLHDDTGEITLLPANASFESLRKQVDRFEEHRDGGGLLGSLALQLGATGDGETLGYLQEEWVITAGTRLFVHGEASDADGELVIRAPRGKGDLVVSCRSEEELLASHASTIRTSTAVGAIAAVVTVGLLVAGLISAVG